MGDTDVRTGPPRALSFLFTDIERSTTLWDRDPAAMRDCLQLHDDILRASAARHEGHVFYCGGDGFGIAFDGADEAVESAREAQADLARTAWPGTLSLRVRMGIHTGAAEQRDGNYFGPTLNRVSRIADAGHGGQVLLSDVTAGLVDRGELVDLGTFSLRGVQERERIWWMPVPETGTDFPPLRNVGSGRIRPPALPTRLRFDGELPLAGRVGPLEQLARAWTATREGGAPVVLVSGEPGIGKTRLVAEAVGRMHADGATVLYGRCPPDGGEPHAPLAEALSTLVEALDAGDVRSVLAPYGGELLRLVPRMGELLPGLASPVDGDGTGGRHRLFTAVSETLAALARRTPGVVLVIDDFNWADPSTVALLEHIVGAAPAAGVMVVVIYRDTDVSGRDAVGSSLASLRRGAGAVAVHLGALTVPEVEALVASAAGHDLGDLGPILAELYSRTGGNPLYVLELTRHLVNIRGDSVDGTRWRVGDLSQVGIPVGIRELVRERVGALPDATVELLETAAILGRDFDARIVAEMHHLGLAEVITILEPAVTANLIQESGLGRFAFVQLMSRAAIYEELSAVRRLDGHVAAARAIETVGPVDDRWAELAHHWGEAAMAGYAREAMVSALHAGELAVRATAHDDAVEHFRKALAFHDDLGDEAGVERVDIQLRLAEALSLAGRLDEAGREFIDAANRARRAGRADLVARAALGLGGDLPSSPPPNPVAVALVEQALVLHPDPCPTRALLLAGSPNGAIGPTRQRRGWPCSTKRWRWRGRPATRPCSPGSCSPGRGPCTAPTPWPRCSTSAPRSSASPRSSPTMPSPPAAAVTHMNASFALGDFNSAVRSARILAVLASRLRQPEYERLPLMWDGFRAAIEGRFETCSAIVDELAVLLRGRHSQAVVIGAGLLLPGLWFRGRSDLVYESAATGRRALSGRHARLARRRDGLVRPRPPSPR